MLTKWASRSTDILVCVQNERSELSSSLVITPLLAITPDGVNDTDKNVCATVRG
ncbi:MAG: hypothetical protein MUF71_04385 [Candidatus Kapabacteria bacterium]|nr:hypothetical protein [Candidatus Kapabacteria bacterium]